MGGVLILEGKKRREEVHGRPNDDPLPGRAAGMRINGLIEEQPGAHRLFAVDRRGRVDGREV